jgi:hypothetical protein
MKEPQTAEQFLREFMRKIVHNPLDRAAILAEYTEKLQKRDGKILDYVRDELAHIRESNDTIEALMQWFKDESEKAKK